MNEGLFGVNPGLIRLNPGFWIESRILWVESGTVSIFLDFKYVNCISIFHAENSTGQKTQRVRRRCEAPGRQNLVDYLKRLHGPMLTPEIAPMRIMRVYT